MRWFPIILLLSACTQESPQKTRETALYAGKGRDRLCIKGDRIGFITYGAGNVNCSVRGHVGRSGEHLLSIVPDGDPDCSIKAAQDAESIRLGKLDQACAYYCGPNASFDGKVFAKTPSASPAVDLAGDPLC